MKIMKSLDVTRCVIAMTAAATVLGLYALGAGKLSFLDILIMLALADFDSSDDAERSPESA